MIRIQQNGQIRSESQRDLKKSKLEAVQVTQNAFHICCRWVGVGEEAVSSAWKQLRVRVHTRLTPQGKAQGGALTTMGAALLDSGYWGGNVCHLSRQVVCELSIGAPEGARLGAPPWCPQQR